jgi:hypothetical protein
MRPSRSSSGGSTYEMPLLWSDGLASARAVAGAADSAPPMPRLRRPRVSLSTLSPVSATQGGPAAPTSAGHPPAGALTPRATIARNHGQEAQPAHRRSRARQGAPDPARRQRARPPVDREAARLLRRDCREGEEGRTVSEQDPREPPLPPDWWKSHSVSAYLCPVCRYESVRNGDCWRCGYHNPNVTQAPAKANNGER